jgi:hypothetical protein
VQFTYLDIHEISVANPPAVNIHFLNTQLKRKLLNKVIHKAANLILRENEQAEIGTEVSISSEKNNLIGLKLLWFTMQHMLD